MNFLKKKNRKSESNAPNKAMRFATIKGVNKEKGTFTATASTKGRDRDGDVIEPDGVNIEEYKKNPVILVGHASDRPSDAPVVARAIRIWKDEDGVHFEAEWADESKVPLAGQYRYLYENGFMRTFSIGFLPVKFEQLLDKDGDPVPPPIYMWRESLRFTKTELLEISAVAVPSNREALIGAASKGFEFANTILDNLEARKTSGLFEEVCDLISKHAEASVKDGKGRKMRGQCTCSISKGAALASRLDDAIEDLVDDDTTRSDIIEDMGDAAGISSGTVNQILAGEINCPPLERLEGFASALGISLDSLISAAEQDGCSYGDDDESGETEENSFNSGLREMVSQIRRMADACDRQAAACEVAMEDIADTFRKAAGLKERHEKRLKSRNGNVVDVFSAALEETLGG